MEFVFFIFGLFVFVFLWIMEQLKVNQLTYCHWIFHFTSIHVYSAIILHSTAWISHISLMSYFLSKGLGKCLRSEKLSAFSGTSGICFSVKASYTTITLVCFFLREKKFFFKSRDWIRSTQNTREARISLAANTRAQRLVLWKGYIRMLGWKKKKKCSDTWRSTKSCWAELRYPT